MWDAHRYDLVTVDYDIPRKDGLEVIKSLAAREPLPTMIMISGAGNEKVAVEAISLGAADYLIKDTEAGYLELLPSVIHQALEKRRVLSEKLRSERDRDRLIHELQLRQAELEAQREELRKSHSELEKWAARYADLYDNPPVGFLTLNREGVILEGNLAGARILGAERDLLVGESLAAFVCPDDRETYVNHLTRAMESGERELCEIRLLSNGNPLVLMESRRSLDAEGKYSQCHIAISDVTHFRRTQRALHESEERYRSLVDLSPDGIIVYDERGVIIFSNPAACEILRCTPDGMLGIPISDLISQDSKEIEIRRMQKALEIGTIPSFVEEKWVRFDGSTVDVEVGSVSIVYDGLPAFQTVVRDITERKNAERALRQGEERLELVLMGADLGAWDCDLRSGKAVFDHQWARMLGYSPEELEASVGAWMYRIHRDDVPEVVSALKDHLLGATPIFESEHRLQTKGGEWKWFLSRGKIVERDEHGWPVRMTGTQQDVTERKHAQELLADAGLAATFGQLAAILERCRTDADLRRRMDGLMTTYLGTRSAAAELVNNMMMAGIGAAAFKQLTPGALSLGSVLAGAIAHHAAITGFPLGAGIGAMWHGLFPAAPSALLVGGVTGGLLGVAAVLTAFAGIASDPLQRALGVHQRRLHRLIDALGTTLKGESEPIFRVRDHYIARIADLIDLARAASQLLR